MFSFVTEDGDQTVELDLILNQVIPEMHPGETYRVQSDDGRRVEIDALVTGLDTEWSGSATNAEMVIVYLGMDRYEMAFAGLLLGDDGLPSEVSGTFRMVQAADAAEGLGDALPF